VCNRLIINPIIRTRTRLISGIHATVSTNLQTEFAAETYLAVGQWLVEQMNIEEFRMIRVGTRKPTALRTDWQDLVPLQTFVKNRAST
jgi:hypothetical protein